MDRQYQDLLRRILQNGTPRTDRTGTGTRSIFGHQMRFNLEQGYPLQTTKRVPFKAVKGELLWFLRGDTNTEWLHDHGITIWDEWQDEDGDLGPIYGAQWRSWDGLLGWPIDQIGALVKGIRADPFSRRHIVSAWNVAEIPYMALPPCHTLYQFYVTPDEHGRPDRLSCQLYQRSGDVFLGVPFNIASYALLTHLVAQVTGLRVGEFVHTLGDAHVYSNHLDQVAEVLRREPKPMPKLWLNPTIADIGSFGMDDIKIMDYSPHPAIPGQVAV